MTSKLSPIQARDLDRTSSRVVPSGRRPATVGVAAGASKPSLKTRSSLSSITNRKQENSEETQHKPNNTSNGPSKRSSVAGSARSTSPTKASLGRRAGLGSATDRSSVVSSAKVPPKGVHPNARSPNPTGTPRSTRPIGYTPQRSTKVSQSSTEDKRLSAISASPSSTCSDTSSRTPTEKSTRLTFPAERPKLLARKSTMSVTIEQRLREMELVNQMLRAAMAEDGNEEDEIKEKYGKQADEGLAELRSKLEEARRNEGKVPLDAHDDGPANKRNGSAKTSDVTELETKLAMSQQESEKLHRELSSLRQQLLHADGVKEGTSISARDSKVDASSQEHLVPGLEETMALHAQELATAHRRADKEAPLSSEEERKALRRSVKQLEQRLVDQKNENDDNIARKEREHSQQMNEMHSLQIRKDQKAAAIAQRQANEFATLLRARMDEIQHLEATALRRTSDFDAQMGIYLQRIQELTAVTTKQTADHELKTQRQNEEITQKQAVIESLQDRVREIHECKDREVESQRFQLTQEHDKAMSNLHFKHEEALLRERDLASKKISELVTQHEQEVGDLRRESDVLVGYMKQQREAAEASRDISDTAQTAAKQESEAQIRCLEQKVQASDLQLEEAKSALGEAKDLLESLRTELQQTRSERDWFKAAEDAACLLLHQSQRDVAEMRKAIDALEETEDHDDEHSAIIDELRKELDATVNALDDKETELGVVTDRHAALVRELESEHGKKVEDLQRVVDELQSAQAELISKADRDEGNYGSEIRRLQSLHDRALDVSHRDLRELKEKSEEELQDAIATHFVLRDENAALQQKLKQAEEVAEQRAMRVREAEAALKVTKAELVEMQTKRPHSSSSPYATSPLPPNKTGQHHTSSLWAAASDKSPARNENLGASIIGNMAGMKEQVRQLANSNEEILSNEERICKNMSQQPPLRWLNSTIKEEDEEEL